MTQATVILPALNEEQAIGLVLDEIRGLSIKYKVLVTDSRSTDRTVIIAADREASIIISRKGKGNAVGDALQYVDTPYVFMMDSDYTYPAEYLNEMYRYIIARNADVIMGYRRYRESRAMTLANRFGNKCLSLLASVLYRYRVKDVCTGMWGFKTEVVKGFNLTSEGFTLEADLFTNAVKVGCEILQMPIHYRARLDGSKAKLKLQDGFKIGWFLIKRRFS